MRWIKVWQASKSCAPGLNSIAYVVDGTSFGGTKEYDEVFTALEASGIPSYRQSRLDSIADALSRKARVGSLPHVLTRG